MEQKKGYYVTLDVEARGLYGQAFAWGMVLTTKEGELIEEAYQCCPFLEAERAWNYSDVDSEFLRVHVLPVCHVTIQEGGVSVLRDRFASTLMRWQDKLGLEYLVVDCGTPCEARFLREVYEQGLLDGVPVVLDLATLFHTNGLDPFGTYKRKTEELPRHNPLMDARQSSRIWHELLP